MKYFKESIKKDLICREYILIKNPDLKVFVGDGSLINPNQGDLPLYFLWGFFDNLTWKFQECFLAGNDTFEDTHMYMLHGNREGIGLTGIDLKPSGVIAKFITEYPS